MATDEHYIAPFNITVNIDITNNQLIELIKQLNPRMKIHEQDTQIHAEARSRVFGFVDDMDIVIDTEQRVIHVRSASRSGHYDFGVNRRRVEKLREQLQQRGLIQ